MPCCTQVNGYGKGVGLGQIDPATIMALQEAFVHAKDLWEDIKQIFGIGAGAREADAIVPLQNQIHQTVLAPVGDYLERVRTGQVAATCAECKTYQSQLLEAEKKWLSFLHNTQWQDGRAAQQAEATLGPIFTSQKNELAQCVTKTCGISGGSVGSIFTTSSGEVNWPVVAGAAGLAYMLFIKGK